MGLFLSEVKGKEQRTLRCQFGEPNRNQPSDVAIVESSSLAIRCGRTSVTHALNRLLASNCRDRIEPGRRSNRNRECEECDQGQQRRHSREGRTVSGRHTEQQGSRQFGEAE